MTPKRSAHRPAVAAAAQGSGLTTAAYLIAFFPVSLGIASALNDDGYSTPLESFIQGLLLGYAVAFLWFLWLVCLVVAAVVGFPVAILVERGLRRAGAQRWRPLAMGALGGAIGALIVVVALLTEITGAEFDTVWPWVVIVIPGAIASAVGHGLASVIRARSAGRRCTESDIDVGA